MSLGLKPYPAYKDSGVEWLGEIPEHWPIERAKWLFHKMDRPVRDDDEVVTCFRDGEVTLRRSRRVLGFTESLQEIGYQGVRRGDLVIHAMDAFAGAVGVSDSDGKSTPVYSVCEPVPRANAHYHAYLVREMARTQWILALAKGIRERSTDFRFEALSSQRVPVPMLAEQAAIVRYLDYMDRRIRRYLRAKQKLIKLLEEQKQVVIHQAVTGQIDVRTGKPYPAYKDSGVEWLGQVPEHWEVRRMKQAFRRIVGGATPASGDARCWGGDVVWITPSDISKSEQLTDSLRHITAEGLGSCSAELAPPGSIIVTSRAPVGNVALAQVPLCTNQGCKALIPSERVIDSHFALPLLKTLRAELQSLAVGTTFTEISTGRLGCVAIPLPPLPEQRDMVQFFDDTMAKADSAIAHAQSEIDLLREYRVRLTADLVTGKLDARKAVANLPDEDEESEPFAEEDLLTDESELDDAAQEEAALEEVEA